MESKSDWDAAVRQTERCMSLSLGILDKVLGDEVPNVRVASPFFVKAKTGGRVIERRGYAQGRVYLLRRNTRRMA